MLAPFVFGFTVSTKSFTDREKDSKKLYQNLTGGVNTMLISPRRWGKSSLVEKVISDISVKNKKTKTVLIDLFTTASEKEFLETFAREVIKASSTKWEDWLTSGKEFFSNLIPKISVGVSPETDFGLSFSWSELSKHKEEVLNLPQTIATKKKIKFIIALDEFQNLATFDNYDNIEKAMRANWQRHKDVTYCLYGSKRHMMTDIFNNPSKPFYRFGDIIMLQKIDTKNWVKFVMKGFSSTGKSIDKKWAVLIPLLMKNHSWYVQQFAHYTWQKTDKEVGIPELKSALSELIHANTPLYQREIESLTIMQINLLKAIVNNETQLTAAAVMKNYTLGTPRNVSKNRDILINNDLIDRTEDGFELLDPAFELWFLKMFYGKDYLLNIK